MGALLFCHAIYASECADEEAPTPRPCGCRTRACRISGEGARANPGGRGACLGAGRVASISACSCGCCNRGGGAGPDEPLGAEGNCEGLFGHRHEEPGVGDLALVAADRRTLLCNECGDVDSVRQLALRRAERVAEGLRDAHGLHEAGDGDVDLGVREREGARRAAVIHARAPPRPGRNRR